MKCPITQQFLAIFEHLIFLPMHFLALSFPYTRPRTKFLTMMTLSRNPILAAGLLIVLPQFAITNGWAFEESEVRPLLETYCFKCHSDKKTKAGINFEEFNGSLDVWSSRKTWTRVKDALDGGEMPPRMPRNCPLRRVSHFPSGSVAPSTT